jgi:phospholipase C
VSSRAEESPEDPMDHAKPIHRVVVLMLENRSFDQMLGDHQNYKKKESSGLAGIDAGG